MKEKILYALYSINQYNIDSDIMDKLVDDLINIQHESRVWIPLSERKPNYNQLCDIWVIETKHGPAHKRENYIFVNHVGVSEKEAFQELAFNLCGLYDMAFHLEENLISHWSPALEFKENLKIDIK